MSYYLNFRLSIKPSRTIKPVRLGIGDQQEIIQEIKNPGRQIHSPIRNNVCFIITEANVISDVQIQVMKEDLNLIKNVPWNQIQIQCRYGQP